MDEKQAITLLKRGDPGGLDVLVHLHQLQAVRTACLIVGDPALAQDIVQTAFIRAAEKIGQFDSRLPFKPWFLRSVIHDAIKAAKRQMRLVSLDQEHDGEAFDLADPAPLPEELVETEETRQAVWLALGQLPPHQRAVIVQRYYLGMSEDEMTGELHRPAGTVKWWLHAARQRLGKLLHPDRRSESETQEPRRNARDEEKMP